MIKTTHPIHYGGAAKAPANSNDPCSPNCGSGLFGGLCSFGNNIMCSFTATTKGISDVAVSGDKVVKMIPMIVILLALGLAVGLSKGHAINIGG